MDQAAAERVLRSYSGKKLTTKEALYVLREWMRSKEMSEDRWGNFHMSDGHRIKLTKQRMRVETKRSRGGWFMVESYPLIEAAYRAIRDAGKAMGQEDVVEKARGAIQSRRSSKKKQKAKRLTKAKQEALARMAVMIASSEDPEAFYAIEDGDEDDVEELNHRKHELTRELEGLEQIGRVVKDADVFSVNAVPVALLRVDGEAVWTEEVDGVTYSIRIAHADQNKATIEIGVSGAGEFHIGVDPLTHSMGYGSGRIAKGDAYISGYVARSHAEMPIGILFMISSHEKQQGAGSRVLDIWCDIMAAFGVERWMAQAVGEEGRAFFAARERDGRLRRIGSSGSNIAFECEGGPRGRQQRLAFS